MIDYLFRVDIIIFKTWISPFLRTFCVSFFQRVISALVPVVGVGHTDKDLVRLLIKLFYE